MRHKFSAVLNGLIPAARTAMPEGGLASAISKPAKVVCESDVPNMVWSGSSNVVSVRQKALHSDVKAASAAVSDVVTGGADAGGGSVELQPPDVREYNPVVHTQWMLIKNARLVPKLPPGTKVGRLVMGKHGLHYPKLTRIINEFHRRVVVEGEAPENGLPSSAFLTKLMKILSLVPIFLVFVVSAPCVYYQKPVGLLKNWKMPGEN